jgi:hypothetical protein
MSQHHVYTDQRSPLFRYEDDVSTSSLVLQMNHSHKGDFEMCSDALEEYKRDSMSFVAEIEKK